MLGIRGVVNRISQKRSKQNNQEVCVMVTPVLKIEPAQKAILDAGFDEPIFSDVCLFGMLLL